MSILRPTLDGADIMRLMFFVAIAATIDLASVELSAVFGCELDWHMTSTTPMCQCAACC